MQLATTSAATVLFTLAFYVNSTLAATMQTSDCQIIGDPDIYGPGVRLGFYLQWVASLIQLFFFPEASGTTRSAAIVTVLAVFINTLCNLRSDTLVAVEWSMLYSIIICLLGWNIPITEEMRRGLDKTGGSYFVLFVIIAVYQIMCPYIIFNIWDYGRQPGCNAKFIFWTSIDAYSKGWIIFLKFSWVLGALFLGGFYLAFAIYSLLMWFTSWGNSAGLNKLLAKFDAILKEDDDTSSERTWLWVLRSTALGVGAIGLGFLEATIKKNNIKFLDTRLSNSGQRMPLLIGIFTLVVTICDVVKAYIGILHKRDKQQMEDTETVVSLVQVDGR
jgi:hypothetical protein